MTKTIVKIMWSPPPEGDSGFPVTGYVLEKHESSQGQWVTEEQVSCSGAVGGSGIYTVCTTRSWQSCQCDLVVIVCEHQYNL